MDLSYIIETQICFAAMWAAYRIFLQDSGMFGQNRFYLLSSLFVSLSVPLFSIPIYPGKSYAVFPAQEIAAGDFNNTIQTAAANTFNFNNILIAVYIIGVAIMLVLITLQLLKLRKLCRGSMVAVINKSHIIYTDKPDIAFSFFNYIFISKNLSDEDISPVIAHEMCHVRLFHSADVVLAQMVLILFWWNPFVWLWQRSLREVHEYQADSKVLELGFDSKHYINLIISNLTDNHPEFVSGFSYSLIKKRLIMISKNKHGIFAKFRILLAIPVITVLLALFSFTRQPDVYEEIEKPVIDLAEQDAVLGTSEKQGKMLAQLNVVGHKTDSTSEEKTAQPLIVINGEVVNKDPNKSLTLDDYLKKLNFTKDDIESISVLKNPKSTEAWGLRGVNGVILVKIKDSDKKPDTMHIEIKEKAENEGTPLPNGIKMENATHVYNIDELQAKEGKYPLFMDGDFNNFPKWIASNLVYPREAIDKKIEGKVTALITVNADGSLDIINISGPDLLSKEVERVIKSSPKWTPGRIGNENVDVGLVIPVDFKL